MSPSATYMKDKTEKDSRSWNQRLGQQLGLDRV